MIKRIYEDAGENAAYMQGFVAGKKADGEDWVRSELEKREEKAAKELAWDEMWQIAHAAQRKISAVEAERDYWRSMALAYQVSLQALVGEDLERGRRL